MGLRKTFDTESCRITPAARQRIPCPMAGDRRIRFSMRRAASILLTLSLLSPGLISCSTQKQPTPARTPMTATQIPAGESGPFIVIGHLEHRDRVITIKSGAQGVVYSVRNRDGKILFDNLTAAQLKTQSPELHTFIEAATAGQADLAAPQLMKVMER